MQLHGKSSGSGLFGGGLREVVQQGSGQAAKSCEFSGASAKPNWEDPGPSAQSLAVRCGEPWLSVVRFLLGAWCPGSDSLVLLRWTDFRDGDGGVSGATNGFLGLR